MAAGDRKIKITAVEMLRANPVRYTAHWQLWIENKVGQDVQALSGSTSGTFGTAATWRQMTGLQMESQVTSDVTIDVNVPTRDSVT